MADEEEGGDEEALDPQPPAPTPPRSQEPSISRSLNKSGSDQPSTPSKTEQRSPKPSVSRSINKSISDQQSTPPNIEQRSPEHSISRSINKSISDKQPTPPNEQRSPEPSISRSINKSSRSVDKSAIKSGEKISGSSSTGEIDQGAKQDDQVSRESQRSKDQEQLGSNASSDAKLLPKSKTTSRISTKGPPPNQRRFREIIGKRELKKEELDKQKGDLRQRLDVLENSVPAVMLWNIWRMSQGGPISNLQRCMKKHFRPSAAGEIYCPRTPSRHYDCRVREAEADRKQAEKRALDARSVLTEKQTLLDLKRQKLEEAKKIQQERKERIDQLMKEAKELKEAAKALEHEDGSCMAGECGDIECKRRLLAKISSGTSIKSSDVECLDRLQKLAETELFMKRQIEDLERREEAYMKTLQQADELWSKIEGDTASVLQEQLDSKAERIALLEQALQEQKSRSDSYLTELEKLTGVKRSDTATGEDSALVLDKATAAKIKMKHRMTGSDVIDVDEKETLTHISATDQETLAGAEYDEFGVLVKPDMTDLATDRPDDLIGREDMGTDGMPGVGKEHVGTHTVPEELLHDKKYQEALGYLDQIGSRLFDEDDYAVCDPEYECQQDYPETEDEQVISVTTLVSTTAESFHGKTSKDVALTPTSQTVLDTKQSPKSDVSLVRFDGVPPSETSEAQGEAGAEDLKTTVQAKKSPITQESSKKRSEEQVADGARTPERTRAVEVAEERRGPDGNQLKSWLDTSNLIRSTIADCLDCQSVMSDADNLANEIAAYTGDKVKSIKLAERKAPPKAEVAEDVKVKDVKSTKSDVSEGRAEKAAPSEVKRVKSREKPVKEEAVEEPGVKKTTSKGKQAEKVASEPAAVAEEQLKSTPSAKKERAEEIPATKSRDTPEAKEVKEKVSAKEMKEKVSAKEIKEKISAKEIKETVSAKAEEIPTTKSAREAPEVQEVSAREEKVTMKPEKPLEPPSTPIDLALRAAASTPSAPSVIAARLQEELDSRPQEAAAAPSPPSGVATEEARVAAAAPSEIAQEPEEETAPQAADVKGVEKETVLEEATEMPAGIAEVIAEVEAAKAEEARAEELESSIAEVEEEEVEIAVIEEAEIIEGEAVIEEAEIIEGEAVIEEAEIVEGEAVIEEAEILEGEAVIEGAEIIEGEAVVEAEIIEGEAVVEAEIIEGEAVVEEAEAIEGEAVVEEAQAIEGEAAVEAEIVEGEVKAEEADITQIEGEAEELATAEIGKEEAESKEPVEEKLEEAEEVEECKPVLPAVSPKVSRVTRESKPSFLPGVEVADIPYLTVADIETIPKRGSEIYVEDGQTLATCACRILELGPPPRLETGTRKPSDDSYATAQTPDVAPSAGVCGVPSEMVARIELTRTQIIEKETIEIVTQTTDSVATQTVPVQKVICCVDDPQIITMTQGVVSRLPPAPTAPRVQDQSTITVSVACIQTEPVRTVPGPVRTSGTSALKLEHEHRAPYAAKDKPDCVCCVCGTSAAPGRMVAPREAPLVTKMPIMLLSSRPGASPGPYRPPEQTGQPKVLCPECRIKRLERQRAPRIEKAAFVPTTCACNKFQAQLSCPTRSPRETKDQSSMAKISKGGGKDRSKWKDANVARKNSPVWRLTSKSDVDKATTSSSDGRASLDGCICYDPTKNKKFACMCGDPFTYRPGEK